MHHLVYGGVTQVSVVTLHQWACKRMYYRVYQRVGYVSPGVWRGNISEGSHTAPVGV